MAEFFKKIFTSDFLPHGTCYLWNPAVLWLNVVSDLIITAAYYAIPALLFVFVRKRKDFTFNWIVAAFAVFILACGTTHLLGVWTVWHATYRLDGVVKAITAAASVTTAILLAPLLPKLVQLPNPTQLAAMNRKLEEEAKQLAESAEALRRHADLLELAHDAFIVREMDGTIRFWNRGAERLYGWPREEALGHTTHDLLQTQHPEGPAFVMNELERSGHWEGELLHRRRDGTQVIVLSRWVSRRTEAGRNEILEIDSDVTGRKNIERALQEKNDSLERANAKFRQLLESAPDGIVIASREGRIVLINSQTERLFGYSREEMIGQPVEMLLPDSLRQAHQHHRTGYFDEPKVRSMGAGLDLKGLRKDGSQFPVEISLSPIETEEGVLVISSVRDATGRKGIERALQEKNDSLERANAKFRQLVESAPDGIVIASREGRIVLINSQTERLFGYSREEMIGQPVEMLMPETLRQAHQRHRTGYFDEPKVRSMGVGLDLKGLRKDGSQFPVEISLSPIETEEGVLVISSVRDATGRKGIERALQEKNDSLERANVQFRQLVESAPDGIVIVNCQGAIVLINSQAERLFGYSREELLGKSIEVLVPEQFRSMHAQHRTGYFNHPRVRPVDASLELFGLRKDGSQFPVEIGLSPIETEEGVLVISSVRDATEGKAFERVLREKNDALEKADAAKDLFLSSMSHELRTPLNAIIGFTGTLLMRLAGPLTPDQERQLKTIQTSGKHLLSMINDVLDLAKVESGKVELQLQEMSCQDVLAEVVSALRPLAEAKSIGFETIFPERTFLVRTERRVLSQIVFNLGNNAIKLTERGSVRLELAEWPGEGPGWAAVHVVDTGKGIRTEERENLLRALERAASGYQLDGLGLGLHLCVKLAALIGGRIEFQSEYGLGSQFTLLIPKS